MERPLASIIFNICQLSVFHRNDQRWLHNYTHADGQMVNKLDLATATIETNLTSELDDIDFPFFWQVSGGLFKVKFSFKRNEKGIVKGSFTVYLFRIIPVSFSFLSGSKSQLMQLKRLFCELSNDKK